jgi:chloramphenicol 3-O-phosphotransferase
MSPSHALPVVALAASAFLIFTAQARMIAIAAVVASGLEVLLSNAVVQVRWSSAAVGLVLGATLLCAGVVAYLRVGAKSAVSAATVVTLVGLVQVLRALRVI